MRARSLRRQVAVRLLERGAVLRLLVRAASLYRRGLSEVLFVGVTGSCGKTTTKELAAAVLATRLRGRRTAASRNRDAAVAAAILRTRPWSGFCVAELGAEGPGTLDALLRMLRPRIAVVTNVGPDHFSAFRTLESTAAEKGKLVASLPPRGMAILNADDPHVVAMAARCAGRVLTFGLGAGADLRAEDVRSVWPERLAFTLVHEGRRQAVTTRLCGKHWVHAVLAALAVGLAAGIPLAEGIRAVAAVEPLRARLSPAVHPDGVTFIRDDTKAPVWSVAPALEVLREARAERKVAVIGTLSDYGGASDRKYVATAKHALAVADEVVFVGPHARHALRVADPGPKKALHAFATVREAVLHFQSDLRPGDLVLIKASNRADHLSRIVLARDRQVACWRHACGRQMACESCELLTVPAEAG